MGCFGKEEAEKVAVNHENAASVLEEGLSYGDTIKLGDHTYVVDVDHLSCRYNNNDIIFDNLGIKDKHAFCSEHYGYKSTSGGWPECEDRDYEALARVVVALYEIINGPLGTTQAISRAAKAIVKASEDKTKAVAKLAALKKQIAQAEQDIIDADAQVVEATAKMNEAMALQAAEATAVA